MRITAKIVPTRPIRGTEYSRVQANTGTLGRPHSPSQDVTAQSNDSSGARYLAFGSRNSFTTPDEAERIVAAQDVEVADAAQKPTLAEVVKAKAKGLEPAAVQEAAAEDAAEADALSDELPL